MKTEKVVIVATHQEGALVFVASFPESLRQVAEEFALGQVEEVKPKGGNVLIWEAEKVVSKSQN